MQQQQELETTTRGVVRRGEEVGGEERNAMLSHSNVPWPQFQAGPGARCQFWAETWPGNVFGGRGGNGNGNGKGSG